MDAAIESIELRLRQLIDHALEGDADFLPQHVAKKNAERIQRVGQQNAAFDGQRYATLAGKLEYFDLRELQDVITSKSLWPRFESRVSTKESLAAKFGQLAELRNGIRHSRSINEICRKEGEAAILWFNRTLAK